MFKTNDFYVQLNESYHYAGPLTILGILLPNTYAERAVPHPLYRWWIFSLDLLPLKVFVQDERDQFDLQAFWLILIAV